jgi:hypothetical protein
MILLHLCLIQKYSTSGAKTSYWIKILSEQSKCERVFVNSNIGNIYGFNFERFIGYVNFDHLFGQSFLTLIQKILAKTCLFHTLNETNP